MSEWSVLRITEEEWKERFSENAHRAIFAEIKPASRDRISYALLILKDDVPIGYVTVREMDDENVYWQFGGVFKAYRRSMTAVKCIETALAYQKLHSRRILTYVENTNLPMLRFYLQYGFLIIGTRNYFGRLMVDLIKELHGNEKPILFDAESAAGTAPTGTPASR